MAKGSGVPQLRGLLHNNIKINLATAIVLAGTSAVLMRVFLGNRRKQQYAEFYRTYDPEAHFERMRKAGLLQSAAP